MADVSPIDVTKALAGTEYPADREAVLAKARDNGADEDVLGHLEKIPDREYEGPSGVTHEVFNG